MSAQLPLRRNPIGIRSAVIQHPSKQKHNIKKKNGGGEGRDKETEKERGRKKADYLFYSKNPLV